MNRATLHHLDTVTTLPVTKENVSKAPRMLSFALLLYFFHYSKEVSIGVFFFAPSSRSRDFCVISFKVLKEKHETRKLENINCGLDVMAVLRHTHDFHINCCRLFLKSN